MRAGELVSDLRQIGAQDQNVIFQFIADYIYEAQLANGRRICDVMDCRVWLEELAEEWKKQRRTA